MATIRKRGRKFQAIVRRGHHSQAKTFSKRADAEHWAKRLEIEIERNFAAQKTNSEKNLLTELSDSEICEEAYGRKNGLASHQYVAKHRELDCLESYTDENLCESTLKKQKLITVSLHHANSTSFKENLLKMQSEKDRRSLDY